VNGILGSLESEEGGLGDVVSGILDSVKTKEFSLDDLFGGMPEEDGEDLDSLVGSIFDEEVMDRSLAEDEELAEDESEAEEAAEEVAAEETSEEAAAEEDISEEVAAEEEASEEVAAAEEEDAAAAEVESEEAAAEEVDAAAAEDEEEFGGHFGLTENMKELTGTLVSALNLDLPETELEGVVTLFSDPSALREQMTDLFEKGAPGAEFLDSLANQQEALASLIDSLKDEDGEYSLSRIAEALKSAKEAEDGDGVVIEGEEISGEELSEYVEKFFSSLGQH
jgi:chemotaxis protein histidine kinase CheA